MRPKTRTAVRTDVQTMRTMVTKTRLALLPLLAAFLVTAACGDDPTEPTPIAEQIIDVETRTIDPGGTATILISLSQASTLQVMFAGLTADNPVRSISATMRLRLSRLNGTDCEPFMEMDAQPGLTAVIQRMLEPASYCVSVIDPGTLPHQAVVTLRLASPALAGDGGAPGAVNFESTLMPLGTATRTFRSLNGGLLAVRLASLTGEQVPVTLGVGLFDTDTAQCRLAQTVVATPSGGPQLTTQIDPGYYCAMLFEQGNTRGPESFSIVVQHP